MGVAGDDLHAIAKLLQLNPLLPDDYAELTIDFADADRLEVTVLPCAALQDRATPSPIDMLDDEEPTVISAIALAVNPRARIDRRSGLSWQITIDPDADPVPAHPLTDLVGGHNYFPADLKPRPVPVSLR
jgi:hypothetical protein